MTIAEKHARMLWNTLASADVFTGLSERARQKIIEALEEEIKSAVEEVREACAHHAEQSDHEWRDAGDRIAAEIRALTF
jgi:TRAP-type C4-dicarboxylate transport system substrate-binding protein